MPLIVQVEAALGDGDESTRERRTSPGRSRMTSKTTARADGGYAGERRRSARTALSGAFFTSTQKSAKR